MSDQTHPVVNVGEGDKFIYDDIEIYNADCIKVMGSYGDKSFDLCVTSPPYDNLRNYGTDFTKWDSSVWKPIIAELYRVLKDGGVLIWVVGDATIKGSETGTSFRQALYAMSCGFNLHDTMIYKKTGGGARGSNLCYWQNFEYMFVLSKGRPKSINLIHDKVNVTGGNRNSGVNGRDINGKKRFKKVSTTAKIGRRENVWTIAAGNNTSDDKTEHPAVFPESLAADHIKSWSNEGEIVFDPFSGSGTTAKMAKKLNRKFIGCEIDVDYFKASCERIKREKSQLELNL